MCEMNAKDVQHRGKKEPIADRAEDSKCATVSDCQIFSNPEFGNIRIVELDGEPWFVGKDVATALGYGDTFGALKKHVDCEDKQNCHSDSFKSNRGMVVVNESGLYSLVMSSRLHAAKKFKRWVTSEVLPSIRKHGAYMTPSTLEQAIGNPDFMIGLLTALKEEKSKNKALEARNKYYRLFLSERQVACQYKRKRMIHCESQT